jgi:predicted dienelactone hydrolase
MPSQSKEDTTALSMKFIVLFAISITAAAVGLAIWPGALKAGGPVINSFVAVPDCILPDPRRGILSYRVSGGIMRIRLYAVHHGGRVREFHSQSSGLTPAPSMAASNVIDPGAASDIESYVLSAAAEEAKPVQPVGIRQIEFFDGSRYFALAVFYPADLPDTSAPSFNLPFFVNLHLYKDAEIAEGKFPLVMFSHGRGSNPLSYAWFAETLASHGYIVAAPYHYRANTYNSSIAYLANKLWQRPLDVSFDITALLNDALWGKHIDAGRIGIAGHSQGGFTSLWIGGAKVNPDQYLAFQRGWKNNPSVPQHLRDELPLDPAPALAVHDERIKCAFAMAPGIIKAFGMDEDGLRQLTIPTYITVGARDTQAPPKENAEFAAKYIPNAELHVIPGEVNHEIFVNECDEEGRDEFPEACIDAPGVDRAAIHRTIGAAALKFFGKALKGETGQ